MLVLARRIGERVQIGEDIELMVVSVRGDQVRLGFSAPRDIAICRSELLDQVRNENVAAARGAALMAPRGVTLTPGAEGDGARRRGPRPARAAPRARPLKLRRSGSDRDSGAVSQHVASLRATERARAHTKPDVRRSRGPASPERRPGASATRS